jgi:hypothetical protein
MRFATAEAASFYRKEFNTEITENSESTEKKRQVRLKPDPTLNND